MKIALIGYGKMGKIIEEIAISRGHEIVLKISSSNPDLLTSEQLRQADVAIEFTRPEAAVNNIQQCFKAGIPVVVGTTGWYDSLELVSHRCNEYKGTLFHASNFSLGVNLFFRLNRKLGELMKPFPQYHALLEEIHHIHKLDAPSGTALTLIDGVIASTQRDLKWKLYHNETPHTNDPQELPVVSIRTGEVPGTHTIHYESDIDRISITHEAFNRKGFATGAVVAAEWVAGKKGLYTMDDLLGN